MIKGWSPKWRIMVDRILPPLDQFKQEQAQLAAQAVAGYIDQKVAESKQNGTPLDFKPMEMIQQMNDLMAQATTPPPPQKGG